MINSRLVILYALAICLANCKEQSQRNSIEENKIIGKDVAQLELKDSSTLKHIKDQFYRNKTGQLFERTFANREVNGIDTLVSIEYFNGKIPQDIDPLTFEQLDGWFAKDKNFAYYYRWVSGGMLCSKLKQADSRSFKMLAGEYLYAIDKKHVFKETEILDGINPLNMKIVRDKEGGILKIISGKKTYIPALTQPR